MEGLDNFLNESKGSSFDIGIYSDGRPSKYGNEYGLSLEDAVENLLYHDEVSDKYDEEEVEKMLSKMKKGDYKMIGSGWQQIKVTRRK